MHVEGLKGPALTTALLSQVVTDILERTCCRPLYNLTRTGFSEGTSQTRPQETSFLSADTGAYALCQAA